MCLKTPIAGIMNTEGVLPGDCILVFKTDIWTENDRAAIKPVLHSHPAITDWSVDLKDRDRVLRIVGKNIDAETIKRLLQKENYWCKILP